MTPRTKLAVAIFVIVPALSLVLFAAGKPSVATAALQVSLAEILYDQADYRSAMRIYLRATECDDAKVRDRARAGTIRAALRIAEFGIAATQLSPLRAGSAADPDVLALAGDTLWASGRFDEAESAYRDSLALDAANARGHNGMARALASKSQLDAALDEVYAALRSTPGDPELQHTLGSVLERMRRYPDAVVAYEIFMNTLPHSGQAESGWWTRNHVAFLKSFNGTVPFEIVSRDDRRRHVIDFRLENGKVIVKASVNGSRPMDFAIDTGAEQTVVTEKTARKLGLRPMLQTLSAGVGLYGMRGLLVGKIQALEIGTLTVKNIPCLIKSPALRGLPVDETNGISPVALGLSMTVDYRNRRLTIGEPDSVGDGIVAELPLRLNRLATVRGDVNGNPASFIVDTGGEAISLNESTARGLFKPDDRRRIKLLVYGASGWDPDAYLLPGVNLAFGDVTLANQPVMVLNLRAPSVLLGYEIGGIVGYRFLSKYRVEFDLKQSLLRLRTL
ncbi:MAG TPA: aspartyl protease family protein [Vicinamibacterales bacterium]|jgi:predicted aspartyl protease